MRASILIALMIGHVHCAIAADIRVIPPSYSGGPMSFEFEGEIKAGDADRIMEIVSEYSIPRIRTFSISSPGGNVSEAIRIGSVFRDYEVGVIVAEPGCFSSCVLILAGAVERVYPGPVGVHRPYFVENMDEDSIEDEYRRMVSVVRAYLERMNVPIEFADLMFSISPDDMTVLPIDQILKYLPYYDPVFEAKQINALAQEYGISPGEYRSRKAFAKQE